MIIVRREILITAVKPIPGAKCLPRDMLCAELRHMFSFPPHDKRLGLNCKDLSFTDAKT